jgi:hypothetical protein
MLLPLANAMADCEVLEYYRAEHYAVTVLQYS